jgi:N-acetylglucosaminyl-diphospho-decaprenol L-rhamnosyltransferase
VPWAVGAFLLVRREAWDAVGGFDERQWLYAEDLDLGWRLRRAGWATRYEPGAVVDHVSAAATGQVYTAAGAIAERWQRSTYGWMVRRRGLAVTWAVAAANAAGAAARWLVMAPAAVLAPDPWRERHHLLGRWAAVHLSALRSRRALERWR